MITLEQARQRAERTYNGDKPSDQRDEIGLHEFDLGYVAWRVPPPRDDPTQPPSTIGGGCIVIDKETGESTTWPLLDPETIAEDYRRRRRGSTAP